MRGPAPSSAAMLNSPTTGPSACGSHELAASAACKRLWALRYGLLCRPRTGKEYQLRGSLVHVLLAYHYATIMAQHGKYAAPAWYYQTPLDEALRDTARGELHLIDEARAVYIAWWTKWAGEAREPIAVEEEFSAPVGEIDPGGPHPEVDHIRATCRPDLLVVVNGEIDYPDYKSTVGNRSTGRLYVWHDDSNDYRMSNQFFQNLHILRWHFDRQVPQFWVRGIIVERIKSVVPYDFDRQSLRVCKLAYKQAARGIRNKVYERLRIRQALTELGFKFPDADSTKVPVDDVWEDQILRVLGSTEIDANFDACQSRFGACDYYDLCGADSGETQKKMLGLDFTWPGRPEWRGFFVAPWSDKER